MSVLSATALPEALAHHQRGEMEPAVRLYREILAAEPDHPEALHLLGVAALQCGHPPQAIELIERAVARTPSVAAYHSNLAEAYRLAGQLLRAAACYQVALQMQPAAVEVAVSFGTVLMQMGRPTDAVNLFRHALKHQPNHAVAHNNLGNACRVLGDLQQAVTHFRRAVALAPEIGYMHGNLGQLLLDGGLLQEALPHCQEAVRLQPDVAAVHNNLGNVYRKLGQLEQAKSCYTQALRLDPNLPMVHANLGRVLNLEGRYEEAANWLQQALRMAPNTAAFHRNLGDALAGQRQFVEAEKHLRAALQMQPRNPDFRFSMGHLHYEQGQMEEAQAEYRSILREYPDQPDVCQHLGEVLLELNHLEEALACFRAALRGNPRFVPAFAHLAINLRAKLPAEERTAMLQIVADPALADAERAPLLYGLAQVCDAEGDYEEAANHLDRANAIELALRRQRGQGYNAEAHIGFVDRLVRVFTPEFFDRVQGFGLDSERPVFIVGLPRSGTSLLEQILASHSRVFGAGELFLSRDGFEKLGGGSDGGAEARAFNALENIDAPTVRALAGTHLHQLDTLNRTADRVIDKMPDNYQYVGFLALLFPNARFLHCCRDPRDVAVSCWMTQFRAIQWTNDFDDIVSRFTQYQRIMDHWRRVLPVPLMDVDYEDLVEDLESASRRVVAFCGLEWEPACLDFHRTRRAVRTASVTQVRQPIYRRSVARWRNYEKTLQPLFDRLEPSSALAVGEELETVAAVGE